MSTMTVEEKQEIADIVTAGIKASGLLEPERKFTPGDIQADEKEPVIMLGDSPEDKIFADPRGGFNDHGEFICAIAGKGAKYYGRTHFDKLKAWNNAVLKIAGTMNEGETFCSDEGDKRERMLAVTVTDSSIIDVP